MATFVFPTFDAALAKLESFLDLISGPVCSGDPLVKKFRKKLAKKVAKARAKVRKADASQKAAAIDKLLDTSSTLLIAVRLLITDAVGTGQLSAECAATSTTSSTTCSSASGSSRAHREPL